MNILITGGSGFVGSWLRQTQPKEISAVYLNREQYQMAKWTWLEWDIIIHAANVSPLHVIHHHSGKMVYISSGVVYGRAYGEYAENKIRWEGQLPHDAVIARLFTFVGAGLGEQFAISKFIRRAASGLPPVIWGKGRSVRTYLHGQDMGEWLWKIALEGTGIYDVGSSVEYTVEEVARMVSEIYAAPEPIYEYHDYTEERYVPCNLRAKKELGCKETIHLHEALERIKHEGI